MPTNPFYTRGYQLQYAPNTDNLLYVHVHAGNIVYSLCYASCRSQLISPSLLPWLIMSTMVLMGTIVKAIVGDLLFSLPQRGHGDMTRRHIGVSCRAVPPSIAVGREECTRYEPSIIRDKARFPPKTSRQVRNGHHLLHLFFYFTKTPLGVSRV